MPVFDAEGASSPAGMMKTKPLLSSLLFTVEQRVHERPGQAVVTRDVVVHPGAVVILPILDYGRLRDGKTIALLGWYFLHKRERTGG